MEWALTVLCIACRQAAKQPTLEAASPISLVTGYTIMATRIRDVIRTGAPMYNTGDIEGCAALYQSLAVDLVQRRCLPELHTVLLRDVTAATRTSADSQAWALRRTFDRILLDASFEPITEARPPTGFPAPAMPIGQIVIRVYPKCRAAVGPSFGVLFSHIQRRGISMTSPVLSTLSDQLEPLDMAFVYERDACGRSGKDGVVDVVDLPETRYVCVGLRGGVGASEAKRAIVEHVRASGGGISITSWRKLSYNSPMVPVERQFWELQAAVQAID